MLFEEDIKDKVKNSNLFEVVYKKDKFVIDGKEYPIGYTSLCYSRRVPFYGRKSI